MARELHRLTAKRVEREATPGRYADGGGLYLQVQPSVSGAGVTKSWLFRYMRAGRAREMGLGPVHTIPLATSKVRGDNGAEREIRGARDLAADARRLLLAGVDPIDAREAAKRGQADAATKSKPFRDCAEAYIKAHRAAWSNSKHAAQWENTLESYAYPKIGALPAAGIDTPQVLEVLQQDVEGEPLWSARPETASRLRGRIESVLDWAKVHGYRDGLNPARWRGHLDQVLPKRSKVAKVEHHAAMPFARVPAFVKELRKAEGNGARALEFTILCAARTGETIGAKWDEIDLGAAMWTIPAERMKAKREHRVPLSPRALEIVEGMKDQRGDGDHVFPGMYQGEPLSNMAMAKVLERLKRANVTVHGFRSSFRDWAAERTTFAREVVEMALAHTIPNAVEAAYRRGDLFEKRRRLMEAWGEYVEKGGEEASVTPIRAAKHL